MNMTTPNTKLREMIYKRVRDAGLDPLISDNRRVYVQFPQVADTLAFFDFVAKGERLRLMAFKHTEETPLTIDGKINPKSKVGCVIAHFADTGAQQKMLALADEVIDAVEPPMGPYLPILLSTSDRSYRKLDGDPLMRVIQEAGIKMTSVSVPDTSIGGGRMKEIWHAVFPTGWKKVRQSRPIPSRKGDASLVDSKGRYRGQVSMYSASFQCRFSVEDTTFENWERDRTSRLLDYAQPTKDAPFTEIVVCGKEQFRDTSARDRLYSMVGAAFPEYYNPFKCWDDAYPEKFTQEIEQMKKAFPELNGLKAKKGK